MLFSKILVEAGAFRRFVSLFNVITLNHGRDGVRARVLAVSMLVFQGAMAGGSVVWGVLAARTGIHVALMLGVNAACQNLTELL